MNILPQNLLFLNELIKRKSGIHLTEEKSYLLETRLGRLLPKYELPDINALVATLQQNNNQELEQDVVEAITTNESSFFRDLKPFNYLKDYVLPDILTQYPDEKNYRILSAACSSGQEALSIAMTILEHPTFASKPFSIIGTDINSEIVRKAQKGAYSQFEVQRGIPVMMLMKYFTQEGEQWFIKDILKEKTTFQVGNLLGLDESLGAFDIIFCRNVIIYFDEETKLKILDNLSKHLKPGGYLFVGVSENIFDIHAENFELANPDVPGVYRYKGNPTQAE